MRWTSIPSRDGGRELVKKRRRTGGRELFREGRRNGGREVS